MISLLNRAEKPRDPKRNPDGYRSAEADHAENAFNEQRDRSTRVRNSVRDPTALLIIEKQIGSKSPGSSKCATSLTAGGSVSC
jgi:hypothetical protein